MDLCVFVAAADAAVVDAGCPEAPAVTVSPGITVGDIADAPAPAVAPPAAAASVATAALWPGVIFAARSLTRALKDLCGLGASAVCVGDDDADAVAARGVNGAEALGPPGEAGAAASPDTAVPTGTAASPGAACLGAAWLGAAASAETA